MIDEEQTIQLKSNKIPRGMISLESFFNYKDVRNIKKDSL